MAPLRGFADLHCHPMAHLGFGGKVLAGKPWHRDGVAAALERCDAPGQFHGAGQHGGHGPLGELVALLVRANAEHDHGPCGFPGFQNWPTFQTTLHQQMYVDWVRRAYDGGLRLMCGLMVNNELLAAAYGGVIYADGWSIEAQMHGLREFAAANAEWLGIASSPAEARSLIGQNKLAIVPGVEVDSLDSLARRFDPPRPVSDGMRSLPTQSVVDRPLAPAEVDAVIAELKRIGIAMVTPVHLTNNSFGGAAVYQDLFNVLNRFVRGDYFQVHNNPSLGFRLGMDLAVDVARFALFGNQGYPRYGVIPSGHANTRDLTETGEAFLTAAMKAGLIVDVDHMSEACTDGALDVAERHGYPVISSHSAFREQGLTTETQVWTKKCHEGQKTRKQALRILQLGGMVAPITNQHELKSHPSGQVKNDCARSAKTWAQSFLYALDVLAEARSGGIAIGTDFNGLAEQPGPRFGDYAAFGLTHGKGKPDAGRDAEYAAQKAAQAGTQLPYGKPRFFDGQPLTQATLQSRSRPFDLNIDGLANYGLLPDFFEDLLNVGIRADQLDTLFNSADAFIGMWERCERTAATMPRMVA